MQPFLFPDGVERLYRINDKDNFLSTVANNSFWKQFSPLPLQPQQLKLLKALPDHEPLWVAFDAQGHFSVLLPHIASDSLSVWHNANQQVQKQKLFGKEWYYTLTEKYLLIGDTPEVSVYHDVKKTQPTPRQQHLQELQKLSSPNSVANVYLPKAVTNRYFETFFNTAVLPNALDWVSLDLFLEENSVRMSGIAFIDKEGADPMLHTTPYQTALLPTMPANVRQLSAYTFEDADKLLTNDSISSSSFLSTINGVAFAEMLDGQFAVTSSFDVDETIAQLPLLSEDFQYNFALYELNSQLPLHFFKNFVPHFVPKYAGVHEHNIVFSPTKELLISVLNEMQRGNVLSANKAYEHLEQHSASNVSYTQLANLYELPLFSTHYPYIAEHYRWAMFQQTPQNDYYVLNFVCERQSSNTLSDEMRERFRFALDDQIVMPPTLLLNHRTKHLEIAVQDANNDFYLIGNNGSLLWKKHLDGKIQSRIYQVDLFKNGFLQMAFSTSKSIWVLDRNGNEVAPFPVKFKTEISPLEVFDYDSNREYRFLVAEKQTLHLLDRKGQAVKGFFQRANGNPLFTPKHVRFNEKDYLIYSSDNGTFNILHRNGENRITVKDRYRFSANPPLLWNQQFTFATDDGKIVSVNEKGEIRQEKKPLLTPFYWGGNKYALYALSGTELSIGNQKISLLEGNYTRPKLFRLRGVNYVSVTDTNTQKAYLYNEKGALVKNFPVESVTPIAIDVDLDRTIWLVAPKTSTELVLYTVKQLEN